MREALTTAAFRLDPTTLRLLAQLADAKAAAEGGSANKSATLRALIRRAAAELEEGAARARA